MAEWWSKKNCCVVEGILTRNDDVTVLIPCSVIHLCRGVVGNGGEETERLPMRRAAGGQDGGGGGGIGETPVTAPIGRVVLLQGRLQVANVVDDVLDHFQLGDFAVLGHVRHQFFQFRQVHLDLHLLFGRRRPVTDDLSHWIHRAATRRRLSFHHFRFGKQTNKETNKQNKFTIDALETDDELLNSKLLLFRLNEIGCFLFSFFLKIKNGRR